MACTKESHQKLEECQAEGFITFLEGLGVGLMGSKYESKGASIRPQILL